MHDRPLPPGAHSGLTTFEHVIAKAAVRRERQVISGSSGSAGFVRLSIAVEPGLQDRAVHDDEAEDEDRQCRNWPEHGARIDPGALLHDPQSEVRAPARANARTVRRVEQW